MRSEKSTRQPDAELLIVEKIMSLPRTIRLPLLMWVAVVSAWTWADPIPPLPTPVPPRSVVPPAPRTAVIGGAKPSTLPANPTSGLNRPAVANAAPTSQVGKPGILKFDATSKHVDLADGEKSAAFVFSVTNISSEEVTISYINTSCGCTAGRLPSYPWKLPVGEGGHIDVSMDLTGKFGLVTKTATVVTSSGNYMLTVSAKAPMVGAGAGTGAMGDRSRNLTVAAADRQAVFRNDCASCHVQPTLGKTGVELYNTACGICHESEHRAQMVPDLRVRLGNTDRNYWSKWIGEGRPGSLMPAFSAKLGGILSDVQIDSLVEYLEMEYKKNPPLSKSAVQAVASPVVAPGASKLSDR